MAKGIHISASLGREVYIQMLLKSLMFGLFSLKKNQSSIKKDIITNTCLNFHKFLNFLNLANVYLYNVRDRVWD